MKENEKRVFGFGNKGVRKEVRLKGIKEMEVGGFVYLFERIGKIINVRNNS